MIGRYNIPNESCYVSKDDSMWDGFGFGNPFSFSVYHNDFHTYNTTTDWTETKVGAGTLAITDESHGVLLMTNAAADNDALSIQLKGESFKPTASKNMYYETRFKVSDATQSDFLVGLVVTDTTPLANANGIYFRKDDGDTNLDFETTASSVSSTESGIFTVQDDTYMKLGFHVVGDEKIDYYVNDSFAGSFDTNIPSTEMRITFHMENGEAVAKTMSVDYIFAAQER